VKEFIILVAFTRRKISRERRVLNHASGEAIKSAQGDARFCISTTGSDKKFAPVRAAEMTDKFGGELQKRIL